MISKDNLIDAVICREDEVILEVSRILRDTQRRHLIVLNNEDFPVGILSAVDLNNRILAEEKDPNKFTAKEVMTKEISVVSLEDSYEHAFQIMARLGTNSIPVIGDNKKLVGLLEFQKAFKVGVDKNGTS